MVPHLHIGFLRSHLRSLCWSLQLHQLHALCRIASSGTCSRSAAVPWRMLQRFRKALLHLYSAESSKLVGRASLSVPGMADSNKATKQQSNKATKQQSTKETKQQSKNKSNSESKNITAKKQKKQSKHTCMHACAHASTHPLSASK